MIEHDPYDVELEGDGKYRHIGAIACFISFVLVATFIIWVFK